MDEDVGLTFIIKWVAGLRETTTLEERAWARLFQIFGVGTQDTAPAEMAVVSRWASALSRLCCTTPTSHDQWDPLEHPKTFALPW